MITFLCQSIDVRVNNGNFARAKPEGVPSASTDGYDKFFLYCNTCESKWESTPESQKEYWEYVWLRDRTTVMVNNFGKDGSYSPQSIDGGELMRRIELAKKIISSYKHLLNLDPAEWHEIELDAQD